MTVWHEDTPCDGCGHTAAAHLGGDLGGECLRRVDGRFCACVAYRPVEDEVVTTKEAAAA